MALVPKVQKPPLYFLARAHEEFEVSQNKELRHVSWVAIKNNLNRATFIELASRPDGAALFGAYIAIVLIASAAKPRWHLVDEIGRPHTAETLAKVSRLAQSVFEAVIPCLIELGELIDVNRKPRKIRPVASEHALAASERGLEHSRVQNRTVQDRTSSSQNEREEKKTEEGKQNGARKVLTTARHAAAPTEDAGRTPFSLKTADDDETPWTGYNTPTDWLKAIYSQKAAEAMKAETLEAIERSLNANRVGMVEFAREVNKHLPNTWKNPAGFLKSLASRFRSATEKATAPVTAEEATNGEYKCTLCGSRKLGEGLRLVAGKFIACACASPEYLAQQRESGLAIEDAA